MSPRRWTCGAADLIARDDGRSGQLAVFGKGSKTRPVLVPRSLFEELSALALPNPDAPLFRSQKKGPDGGLLCDTGLISSLQGLSAERLAFDPILVGLLVESFVAMKLRKQAAWSQTQPRLFHFRTQAGQEVDIVLEDAAGRVVGVEVKAAATVGARDFRGLRALELDRSSPSLQ